MQAKCSEYGKWLLHEVATNATLSCNGNYTCPHALKMEIGHSTKQPPTLCQRWCAAGLCGKSDHTTSKRHKSFKLQLGILRVPRPMAASRNSHKRFECTCVLPGSEAKATMKPPKVNRPGKKIWPLTL